MTSDDFDLSEPRLTADDILVVEDPLYRKESTAIVTGAASGIGQATAVALAKNDLTVVGADIDEEGLTETEELLDRVNAEGGFIPVSTDLTDDDDVEQAVETAAKAGELRYVANIAGIQHISPIPEFPTEKFDLLLDIMLRAPFLVSKFAMPYIRENEDGVGAIGNMSSIHGHYATQDKSAYITAKHGLMGLTRAIAAEGDGKLRGFTVSVGYVLTPLMVNQIEDTADERGISAEEVVKDVMLGQARTKEMMTPVEVANLFTVGFSRHGKHLNGGDMLWDGGYITTYE